MCATWSWLLRVKVLQSCLVGVAFLFLSVDETLGSGIDASFGEIGGLELTVLMNSHRSKPSAFSSQRLDWGWAGEVTDNWTLSG